MRVVKRAWGWFDDRTGLMALLRPIMEHRVPRGSGWWYVFGSATLFVFILQVVVGIVLATAYVTSTRDAYQSLQFITNDSFMGRILRGMHFFGASAMVILIGLHVVRVFLMGSYKFPREMNWLTGVGLLLFTLAMAFTGQLLRWDQNAVWSVVVGAEQAGRVPIIGDWLARFILAGDTVGGATLSRFFAFHVFFIPALLFLVIGFHLWLVLRNGISEPPVAGQPVNPKTYRKEYEQMLEREGQPFWPDSGWRDALFGASIIIIIALLAILIGPPALDKPPDPTITQAYPRPDWYFLWYYAVLAVLPHGTEPYVIVGAPVLFGLMLLLLPFVANKGERSPWRRPWAVAVVLLTVLAIAIFGLLGRRAPWSPDFTAQALSAQTVGQVSSQAANGAMLFHQKGCEYCHAINGQGGNRGPDLTTVGSRLSADEMTIRILNGGNNMPAFGGTLTPQQVDALVAFLQSRK
jgi:ubiquinol-cytochrome c reductase cytochrome b subunit